jgi:maltodextrin utilization protein YvdJ
MIKRLLVIATLGFLLSGCYMVPMALVGPVTSGFNTGSIIQSGISTSTNYLVKAKTGKTIGEHAFDAIFSEQIDDVLKQTYFPEKNNSSSISSHKDLNSVTFRKK